MTPPRRSSRHGGHRGRRPATDLPDLSSRAPAGVACRAHAAAGRGTDDRRGRSWLPRLRGDDGSADLACQGGADGGRGKVRAADGCRARAAPRRRHGGDLPDLQRGAHRHGGQRLDACSACRRWWSSRALGWQPGSTSTAIPSCWRLRRASRAADTNWRRIAALYDVLATAASGPVVEVNCAVAHGRAFGPVAGLVVLATLGEDALPRSPLVPSVRGDLLERAGRFEEADDAFTEAAARTRNESERRLLTDRARQAASRSSSSRSQ